MATEIRGQSNKHAHPKGTELTSRTCPLGYPRASVTFWGFELLETENIVFVSRFILLNELHTETFRF